VVVEVAVAVAAMIPMVVEVVEEDQASYYNFIFSQIINH
jgi:hypothetical protein